MSACRSGTSAPEPHRTEPHPGVHQKKTRAVLVTLPTSAGDGPYLGSSQGHRPADYDYLRQIAVAADRLGYGGILLPTGPHCEDG